MPEVYEFLEAERIKYALKRDYQDAHRDFVIMTRIARQAQKQTRQATEQTKQTLEQAKQATSQSVA